MKPEFQVAGTALLMLILTLSLQCGGLAVLMIWVRRTVEREIHRLHPLHAAGLLVRLTRALIVLNGFQVLLWACCYRRLRLPSWEHALYFSAISVPSQLT